MMQQDDISLLQGRWLQISYERDGIVEPTDCEKGWNPLTEILDQGFTVMIADGSTILRGMFELDQTLNPKEIDWIDKAGVYASTKRIKAIYTLNETDFVFCASYNGEARPTEFKTKLGQVLRRMKRI